MATPGKATKKEKKKPVQVKTSLNNPYDLKWKPLEKGHARFILKTVTEKFGSLDLRKRHVKVFRKWRSKRKQKKGNSGSLDTAEPTHESMERGGSDLVDTAESTPESKERGGSDLVDTAESTPESKERGGSDLVDTAESTPESKARKERGGSDLVDTAEPTQERGWTDVHLRNELAIGINEVTKGLEKNELALVLVCDSVKPAHMTSHLISLSQTRSVPACQVPGLSASLGEKLGLTSVLALGFKRQSVAFAATVSALAPKVPPLDVTWVHSGRGGFYPEVGQVSGDTKQQHGDEETGRGRKRKLENSPEINKDQVTLLQRLKVKRIIPNPSKTRKPKKKKAKQR